MKLLFSTLAPESVVIVLLVMAAIDTSESMTTRADATDAGKVTETVESDGLTVGVQLSPSDQFAVPPRPVQMSAVGTLSPTVAL